ncbi:uncharacterized protein METZ01_LOCUS118523 [marine metagenome]|uniref:Uncharacterized protein n=1 Tax=marine metagenome TaxID=408172 RepID=A0A381XLT7_9ZZZZ
MNLQMQLMVKVWISLLPYTSLPDGLKNELKHSCQLSVEEFSPHNSHQLFQ